MSEPVKFLDELNQLIEGTSRDILARAKSNAWTRLANAIVHKEPTELWYHLYRLVSTAVIIKDLIH